jgi:hypothetical protein
MPKSSQDDRNSQLVIVQSKILQPKGSIVTKLDKPGVVHLQNGSQVKFDTIKIDTGELAPGI